MGKVVLVSSPHPRGQVSLVVLYVAQSPDEYCCSALKCAETYLATYPKPNGQSRDTIQRFLNTFLDKYNDEDVNCYVGKCMHFLQQTTVSGGGGASKVNLKTGGKMEQWKEYQLYLIDSLDGMLEEAYGGGEKATKSNDQREKELSILPSLQLSPEPNVRASQIFVRFHNLINYLRTALSVPNNLQASIHQSKPIAVKKKLNLINRGLERTCAAALNPNGTYSNVAFGVFLPKIQLDLLDLTKILMLTLHCHLRMYYKSLLGYLIHVLKSTPSSAATHKSTVVRTQVYNLIALWCQLLGEGSRCELYADELIPELLSDITVENNKFVQQIKPKNERKNNKTAAHAAPKRKESLTKSSSSFDQTSTQVAAYLAAIKSLQSILRSCACFMKPSMLTTIQMTTLKHCASFFVVKRPDIYKNWKIRLEIYRLLHTIMRTSNQYSPPASQIIIYILHEAQSTESNTEIRLACTEMLEEIEKILHPQKESLIIPIEARAIRNAFSRLGKEAVLEQYHDAISSLRWNQDKEVVVENQRNGDCILDAVDIAPTAPVIEVMEPEIYSPPKNKRNSSRDLNDGIIELPVARQEVSSPIRKKSTSFVEEI